MKEIKKIARSVLVAASLLICSFSKAQECACPDVLVTDAELRQYRTNYETLFVTPGGIEKHTKWVYLSRNYFILLDSFFKEATDYTGVTFHFTCHNVIIDRSQQSNGDQIMFSIAAGRGPASLQTDTLYLFHLKKDLLSDLAVSQIELSTRMRPGPSLIGPLQIMHRDLTTKENYQEKYSNTDIKYTRSVFVCKSQIKQLRLFLDSKPSYEGVKVYFGSYNGPMPCVGLSDEKQFTLFFAPVRNNALAPNLKEYNDFLNKFTDPTYNHGSLCPNSCN